MLKGIPSIISPELLKVLMEMGHGDEIVIGDGNYPGASMNPRCIRLDGHGVPDILEAILKLMPLDTYAQPTYIMQKTPGDTVEVPILDTFKEILKEHTSEPMAELTRQEFYDRSKKAYAIIMSGETALYANIGLKKGVVVE